MPEFECGAPDWTLLVRANDEDETVSIVQRQARERHDREVDEERVRSRIDS